MPKPTDQSDTKAKLIEATLLEMAEKGWGGLRTREVAERAGVNKALVHYHFGSMDNLRYETAASLLSGVMNEAATALLEGETLADGMRRFASTIKDFGPEEPNGVVAIEIMLRAASDPRIEQMLARGLTFYGEALAQRIEVDVEAGHIAPDTDPEGLATALAAALDGIIFHSYLRPETDFRSAAEAFAALLEYPPTEMK